LEERRRPRSRGTAPRAVPPIIPGDKKLYRRQIEATDRQIDGLVYELYGLMEEEIAIVEGREE